MLSTHQNHHRYQNLLLILSSGSCESRQSDDENTPRISWVKEAEVVGKTETSGMQKYLGVQNWLSAGALATSGICFIGQQSFKIPVFSCWSLVCLDSDFNRLHYVPHTTQYRHFAHSESQINYPDRCKIWFHYLPLKENQYCPLQTAYLAPWPRQYPKQATQRVNMTETDTSVCVGQRETQMPKLTSLNTPLNTSSWNYSCMDSGVPI